ncbi:MAG TPA: isoprenylcysteine carboxylmethyltransferase family protein [Thermodesulfovibrionales bacterium]|nr:isoprenylcysteine carboxylmethyltransferase family protein [Thermodesulfovibrionales bacterium]
MQHYVAALTMVLWLGTVLSKVLLLKRKGTKAMHFGKIDKKDFLILPFALFYFYVIFAAAFNFPVVSNQQFFHSGIVSWIGVFFCLAGVLLLLVSIVSFGTSFRVGIDVDNPDKLVTTGVFALSRNPIYVAFGFVLFGQFLVFSNCILLIYMVAAAWPIHRQVLREEQFLGRYYGEEYSAYCARVRRYF